MFIAVLTGFSWFALRVQFTVCLTWTKYPDSVTPVWNGTTVTLKWDYILTTEEQNAANIAINRVWDRSNESHFDFVASKNFITGQSVAYAEDFKPHITISRSEEATLIINKVAKEDEGVYKFTVRLLTLGNFVISRNFSLEVRVQPTLQCPEKVSVKQGEQAIISCNVTGDPKPNITWTKDSHVISHNSTLVIYNVRISGSGTYNVTANNGRSASVLVELDILFPPGNISRSDNQTVNEGSNLTLFCNSTGKPTPNITWTRVPEDEVQFVGNPWHILNINRTYSGTYRCIADNGVPSPVNSTISINVLFKPDVTLERNTTENNGCTDMWVNFTCKSSEANPPVHNYVLIKNETVVGVSEKGTWIEKISRGETFVYKCQAYHQVDNVTSTNDISLSVKVPVAVEQIQNITVEEGRNVTKECNVTAGTPPVNCFWKNMKTGQVTKGKLLTIPNIRRNESGEYRCTANNTCGNESTGMFIDVHFKPDNVTLERNTTGNNGCTDMWVNFTCKSSEANPPVYKYVLLRNETVVGLNEKGTWTEKISRGETFVYKCQANQQVDNVRSTNNISLSVKVPVAVEQIQNVTVEEGRNVTKECNVTAGTPPRNYFWKNMKTGQVTKGKLLTIPNIRRNESGEYRCTANNTCGNESTGMFIDVHFKPDNVTLERNTTENNGCTDMWVNFTCNSSEANPPVHNYVLLRNETDVGLSEKGTWTEKISRGETFVYRCRAYQKVDNVSSTNNVTVTVNDAPTVKQLLNVTVVEIKNVTKECNEAAGTHPLNFFWTIVKTGQVTKGKLLNIPNIRRDQSGEYRCTANNTCGNESTTMFINVTYPPNITHIIDDRIVNETDVVLLNCTADGNPPPKINWTRLADNITVSKVLNITGKQDEGLYRCTAENDVGNAATKDVNITVLYHRPYSTLLQTNTSNNSVIMNETFSITCTTEANPPAKYEIYRDQTTVVGNNSVVPSSVTERVKRVTFTCKPSNFYGIGQMADVSLDVLYHPYITSEGPHVLQVQKGSRTSYPCPIDGNPPPDFKWYRGKGISDFIDGGNNLSISESLSTESGWYTCRATNKLGDKIIYLHLIVVEKPTPSSVSPTVPESEGLFLSMTSNASCEQLEEGQKKIPKAACDHVKHLGCSYSKLQDAKCGSIIVDFMLKFNQSVVVSEVMTTLQEAAKGGTFGGFQINSVKRISQPATPTKESFCDKPFHRKNCEIHWTMVGILIGCSLVFVVVVAVIIGYYVQKRRNCRHPTKVHDSSPDVQPLSSNQGTPSDGNIYAGENGGYAKSGPLPTVDMVTEQQLGAVGGEAIPTYSTVDKSKKKDKKKDKKAAEQKEMENQYAAVDKTKKKKKKNEVDDTYAEVDMSKKSKKNPKAGEVLYADLGEFHAMQKMPEVSTSPKTLPPIKMPEAYGETQYADITQFFKEKPGDTGAEPPKESTTSAVRDTAAGSKEESPAGNVNETGF